MDKEELKSEGTIIAYSMPGTTEFINATVRSLTIADHNSRIEDYDWIFSPFDLSSSHRILIKISSYAASRKFSCRPVRILKGSSTSIQLYSQNFKLIKDLIKSGEYNKLVLSRVKHHYTENEDLYPFFVALKNQNPSAFTYLIHIPEVGTWIGASPEQLLSETQEHKYLTKAIAGTLALEADALPVWSNKEIEEHRFIETYLSEVLEDEKIPFDITPTTTIRAGKMAHISSEITIEKSKVSELSTLLKLLHPGPALSGMPKEAATKKLANIESHSRSYYCGLLGPLKGEQGLSLFANIRCTEAFQNGFKLYLGGGVTIESELQKEWEETELKSSTILDPLLRLLENEPA